MIALCNQSNMLACRGSTPFFKVGIKFFTSQKVYFKLLLNGIVEKYIR